MTEPLEDYYREIGKYGGTPKPERRAKTKHRQRRMKVKTSHEIHDYVFARERHLCRICRIRPAESMHELKFRSLGGKVSRRNSIAVCGNGVEGCHGHAQRLEIAYRFEDEALGAEGAVIFTPRIVRAAEWLRVQVGQAISSPPMFTTESD